MSDAPLATDLGWEGEHGGPWPYTLLEESKITSELARIGAAKTVCGADCISFQPVAEPASQDRYAVLEWDLLDGTWKCTCVFDGHVGEETVDYAVEALPTLIRSALSTELDKTGGSALPADTVSRILASSVEDFDTSIRRDLEALFPGGIEAIESMSEDTVDELINDGGRNSLVVHRALKGTTALVSLVDPQRQNLWVVSLGDCQAALGYKDEHGAWQSHLMSSYHNGLNEAEQERIRKEHPGEPDCITVDATGGRVVGMAVTRALGDMFFKLPVAWYHDVFSRLRPGNDKRNPKIAKLLPRMLTPPYLSATPDVQYHSLPPGERFLVMCSDGLIDLYDKVSKDPATLAGIWVRTVGEGKKRAGYENRAMYLLREAMGGDDVHRVSSYLTVQKEGMVMDDTTVLVQTI